MDSSKSIITLTAGVSLAFLAGRYFSTSAKSVAKKSSASTLKFISNKVCPFAHRVWITLLETGCEFEFKEASLSEKPAWFTEIYRKAIGNDSESDGSVPVIQDGDFVLAESAVIAHYIVNKYGGPLADVTPEEEARIQIFQEQYGGYVISPYYGLLRAQDAETQAKQRDELLSVLRYISKQYSQTKGPYFLGDKFSFADLLWWPWIHRLSVLAHYRNFVVPQEPEYAAYHQYVAAMSARPSIQATSMPAQFFIDGYKSYANPQE